MSKKIATPIVITGASGFIGANLVRRLVATGHKPHLILRNQAKTWRINDILEKAEVHRADLTNQLETEKVIKAIRPKTIFHLAAYGAYPFQKEMEKIRAMNLDGTINLLQACGREGFEIFINTGSSSEYGFKDKPMKETDILEPNSYYAVFKAAATLFCQYFAKEKKLPVITLRPFAVYGPYEEPTRLVPTLITSLSKNVCPPLVDPKIARDYIYVDDMVEAYILAAQKPELAGEIFNIGSGSQTTLKEIVDTAISLTGAKVKPEWGTMPPRIWDQNIWQADIAKAKKMLGFSPKNDLRSGLSKTIGWFKQNINLYQ